jgi:ABC-type Fe3+ transport system permease subunit
MGNRMDAEIKRQWPKSKVSQQDVAASCFPANSNRAERWRFQKWVDVVLRHPIIVGLVLLGVPALITVLSKVMGGWPKALPTTESQFAGSSAIPAYEVVAGNGGCGVAWATRAQS